MIRILIVDDSATLRTFLKRLLNDAPDLEVVGEAVDGLEAVEMARELAPDLITMDLKMPRLDGIEAIHRIMEDRPTPIVIISAYTDTMDLTSVFEAMRAGALDVLSKPRDADDWLTGDWTDYLLGRIRTLANVTPMSPEETNQ